MELNNLTRFKIPLNQQTTRILDSKIILNILFAEHRLGKSFRSFLLRLSRLIETGSFDEIKEMMENLPPDQCTRILTSTIDNCAPLSITLRCKNIKISKYLFQLTLRQEQHEISESWNRSIHPLINAMRSGCIEMMYLISRNLRDINDLISGRYTPLLHAVFSTDIRYVRLILLLGADINKPGLNGISPLIASSFNSKMCSFLLSQNANINQQDDDGNTALHLAAYNKQTESVKILINAEVDVKIRNKDGLTPLIAASVSMNHRIVMDLCELTEYSQLEKIEALEVLSACWVCYGYSNISYWFRALEMRNPRFPKIRDVPTKEILDFSTEFTTRKQLENLQTDQLKLAFQGILVIERTLGRNNKVYLRLLLQTALIAKNMNWWEKVQQLIDYILQYCQEAPAHIVSACSYFFKILFTEISSNFNPGNIFVNRAFEIFKMIARATLRIWQKVKNKRSETLDNDDYYYSELADTFLYITSRIGSLNLPEEYEGQFSQVVIELVKEDPRYIYHQSLLHRVVNSTQTETWASTELMRLLLESGADINSKDYFRRTPLMCALLYRPDNHIQEILELFLSYKCHLDCRNNEGFSVIDFPRWEGLPFLPRSPRSLQCLAVSVILDDQIEYEGILSEGPKIFVDLHR